MRKSAASAALIGAVGFSALSMAPASAAMLPFQNCEAAGAAGVYNIPASSPAYSAALDSDSDGVGCESDVYGYDTVRVGEIVASDERLAQMPEGTGIVAGPEGTDLEQLPQLPQVPQVEQAPVGGADTGVAVEPAGGNGGAALTGGLVLAAVAGGAFFIRRRGRTA